MLWCIAKRKKKDERNLKLEVRILIQPTSVAKKIDDRKSVKLEPSILIQPSKESRWWLQTCETQKYEYKFDRYQ